MRDKVARVDDRRKGTGSPVRRQEPRQQLPEHGRRQGNENLPEVSAGVEGRKDKGKPAEGLDGQKENPSHGGGRWASAGRPSEGGESFAGAT
jgi:hypothetical protein